MTQPTPPGWYADPWGQAPSRWWDGAAWTAHVGPPEQPPAQVAAPQPSAFAQGAAAAAEAERVRDASVPRLEGDRFEVSQRFHLMLNEYVVNALDGPRLGQVALVRQKRIALREQIELWTDGTQGQVLCRVKARSVIDVNAAYDVTDSLGRVVGSLRKRGARSLLRSTWEVCNVGGDLVATVTERSLAVAIIRRVQGLLDIVPVVGWLLALIPIPFGFTFTAPDGRVVGEHRRVMGVRDRYHLTMHADPEHRVDRRLAVSLAICLDALQSR